MRQAKPGERFGVAIVGPGKYVLTKLEPVKPRANRVKSVKRDGYTVRICDQPVSEAAIREALADFP